MPAPGAHRGWGGRDEALRRRGEHDRAAWPGERSAHVATLDAIAGRDARAGLQPAQYAGPGSVSERLPGPAGDPGLLPGRLEPRVRRPDVAVPGAAAGVPALRRGADRDLRGRHLEPP